MDIDGESPLVSLGDSCQIQIPIENPMQRLGNVEYGSIGGQTRGDGLALRATIMTSNRPLEDWGKLVGDVPSATAILDRFLHHAEVIQITGKSYRLRNRAGAADPKKTDDHACKDG